MPRTKLFRIAGTFFTGMYEYDLKFIYVELTALQDFLDIGDEVRGIEIRVRDPEQTDEVMERMQALFPPFGATVCNGCAHRERGFRRSGRSRSVSPFVTERSPSEAAARPRTASCTMRRGKRERARRSPVK